MIVQSFLSFVYYEDTIFLSPIVISPIMDNMAYSFLSLFCYLCNCYCLVISNSINLIVELYFKYFSNITQNITFKLVEIA